MLAAEAGEKLPLVLRRMLTMVLVMLGWALFYFENLGALGAFLGRLFTAVPSAGIAFYLPVTALGCLCATPALKRVSFRTGCAGGCAFCCCCCAWHLWHGRAITPLFIFGSEVRHEKM